MKTQFTPGPWKAQSRSVSDNSLVVKDAEFNEICVIRDRLDRAWGEDNDRDMANSALIAAAPDLLAACLEYMKKWNDGELHDIASLFAQADTMSKAIAKAQP